MGCGDFALNGRFFGVFAQPDPMARLCRLRGWREKEAEPGSGLRVLHGGLLQPLQQDGPVACHGAGDVEFHAPCVPDHAAASAQNLFAEGAEAPAFPGGVLHGAAALVHGLPGEQGEQEKGFVLRPPLLCGKAEAKGLCVVCWGGLIVGDGTAGSAGPGPGAGFAMAFMNARMEIPKWRGLSGNRQWT